MAAALGTSYVVQQTTHQPAVAPKPTPLPTVVKKTDDTWERFARLIVPFMAKDDFPHFFKEWAAGQKSDCKPLLKDQLPLDDKTLQELAQELWFPKSEIETAAKKQGELSKMLGERCDLVASYASVMGLYKENAKHLLCVKRTQEVTTFATKHMLATLAKAFQLQIDSKDAKAAAAGSCCTFRVEQYKFEFLYQLHGSRMHVLEYSTAEEIGKGACGVVRKTLDITSGVFRAIKLCVYSKEDADEKGQSAVEIEARKKVPAGYYNSKETLFVEFAILKELATLKMSDGVQPPPNYVFDGVDMNGTPVIALTGKLYEFNLLEWLSRDDVGNSSRLECCEKLIELLFEFHSKGVKHRDIKPDNICTSGLPNATKFTFVDWALSENDISPENESGFAHTAAFMSLFDLAIILKIKGELKEADLEILRARLKPYIEKCDVFALGITLYAVLAADFVFPYDSYPEDAGEKANYAKENAPFDKDVLLKRGIPAVYVDVIATMVKQKPDERPDIRTIKITWEAAKACHEAELIQLQI